MQAHTCPGKSLAYDLDPGPMLVRDGIPADRNRAPGLEWGHHVDDLKMAGARRASAGRRSICPTPDRDEVDPDDR